MNKECVTCAWLDKCKQVTPSKILEHFCCAEYEEVMSIETIKARCDVINKYGANGLAALLVPDTQET